MRVRWKIAFTFVLASLVFLLFPACGGGGDEFKDQLTQAIAQRDQQLAALKQEIQRIMQEGATTATALRDANGKLQEKLDKQQSLILALANTRNSWTVRCEAIFGPGGQVIGVREVPQQQNNGIPIDVLLSAGLLGNSSDSNTLNVLTAVTSTNNNNSGNAQQVARCNDHFWYELMQAGRGALSPVLNGIAGATNNPNEQFQIAQQLFAQYGSQLPEPIRAVLQAQLLSWGSGLNGQGNGG